MKLNELTALGPLDGRYRPKIEGLSEYFSEYALMKYRVIMEVKYFQALCAIPLPGLRKFPKRAQGQLQRIADEFDLKDARRIKSLERTTNHDVKAVEYFLKERFQKAGLSAYQEYLHLGLTSQDINNTAIPLSLKHAHQNLINPSYKQLIRKLKKLANQWKNVPMLARTHGQPASPTKLGKEIRVFQVRLEQQLQDLNQIPFTAKFGGATGNFNAHSVAYSSINWERFAQRWLKSLGLQRSHPTTQIDHYDYLSAYLDNIKRLNTILTDFARDMWQYIAMNYFNQKIAKGEVGSSTMPHKVNPIDFENAEGNLGLANTLCEHLSGKLPISRLQRDLTDSTVLRNLGVPLGHTLIALQSLQKGCDKLQLNRVAIHGDLEENWVVIAEAIQTILRREGFPKPYEALKDLTRKNHQITKEDIYEFIQGLKVDEHIKEEMLRITPYNYTGY